MGNKKLLMEMGVRIYQTRISQGLTQEKLAELMDVSTQMISNLECGRKAIRPENLVNLCNSLNVSTDYILTGKISVDDSSVLTNKIAKLSEKDRRMIELIVDYCSK